MTVPPITSPIAEAVEECLTAQRAWNDGPLRAWQEALTHAQWPGYDATIASQDAMKVSGEIARALLATAASFMDAIAGLADPPMPYQDHLIRLDLPDPTVEIACECVSWTPFGANDLVNPPLIATARVMWPTTRPMPSEGYPVRVRISPVPATPDLALRVTMAGRASTQRATLERPIELSVDTRWPTEEPA